VTTVRRWLGIRGRLILNVLTLVALSLWLLGVMLLRQSGAFLAAEQQGRGRAIATAVEKALGPLLGGAPLVAGRHQEAVGELLDSLLLDPSIQAIALCDGTGRPFVSSGAGAACRPPEDGGAWVYPVQLPGSAPATVSVLFSSRDSGRRTAYAHLQVMVQLGITALVLVLFLHLLLSVTVVGPIRRLAQESERIASGDLERPVEPGRPDEIGDLAAAFDAMRVRLRAARELDGARIEELRVAHADLVAKEAELVRSERLAAIGGVAAGVAHEVGNPLGAVTGYLAMLRGGALAPEEASECLERTEREVARINRIMLDLLNWARPPRLDWADVDLNALMRDLALHLAAQPDARGVALRLALAEGLPAVRADYHRARQMFLNLALNAVQALDGAGTLTLATFRPETAGRGAGARVVDDGPGIAPEVAAHLFEPFTTAGKGGRGTGLGLAICRRTAEELGATIDVESAPGAGTTFTVLFSENPPAPPLAKGGGGFHRTGGAAEVQ
jgi:signal transduction histidine kinase